MLSEPALTNLNKSHYPIYPELKIAIENLKTRFLQQQNSTESSSYTSLEEISVILEDLAKFPLGQHILLSGGSNGAWTDYLISPQEYLSQLDPTGIHLSLIERFFLFSSPAVLAQRELHQNLQKTAQKHLGNNKIFASIPCGLMRDFLSLDYSGIQNVSLVGIDIDRESLEKSRKLAAEMDVKQVTYVQADAWNLEYKDTFDFISSVGLNMYEKNEEKVIDLYRNLFTALKPGGILFTGILTWPPYLDRQKTDWVMEEIPKYDLRLETVLHKDVLNIQWLNCRTLAEAKEDFIKAGFTDIRIEKDSKCIFPAIIATK